MTHAPTRSPCLVESLEPRTLLSRALGIDVSHYQGTIDWAAVKASGISFAYTKSTEGFTYNDPTFVQNVTSGTAAGVLMGGYHFARYDNNTAADEVNHYLQIVGPYIKAGYLVPMLDVENPVAAGDTIDTKPEISAWVNEWCTRVLNATSVKPIIYTYISYANNYLDSSVTQWPLWMANYNGKDPQTAAPNSTGPWSNWSFWQYTSSGVVSGIAGNVDRDVYNGDLTALKANFVIKPQTGTIAGSIFHDANADGFRQTSEGALKGWTVYLDKDNDGVLDAGEPTAVSDLAGNYQFKDVPIGKYVVREKLQSGWRRSTAFASYTVNLQPGQNATGYFFGNTQRIIIWGTVFNDVDSSGTRSSTEVPLGGWKVFIDANRDGKWNTGEAYVLSSSSSGTWAFNLGAGSYRIGIVPQTGWNATKPSIGYYELTIGAGVVSGNVQFAEHKV